MEDAEPPKSPKEICILCVLEVGCTDADIYLQIISLKIDRNDLEVIFMVYLKGVIGFLPYTVETIERAAVCF